MKIAYITNLRAPYRTLQLNEYSDIENVKLTVYYTDNPKNNRKWTVSKSNKFKEVDLKGIKIAGEFGYINRGLVKIIKSNDLIILGCYEQPTYIVLSILCRIYNKPYILSFDGISTNRLNKQENYFKKFIKNIVIKRANYIMGNGTVSKRYFNEVFGYPIEKIYNQYLTVDSNKINELYNHRDQYRKELREKLNIAEEDKVLIYSGRLIDIKNIDSVVKAISRINKKDIVFLITGGGELEEYIIDLSNKLGVRTIITGFISEQEELFKHYFIGDALILPSSVYEVWGLVINEAMWAGLPVLVSEICGCSLDLVEENKNGYIINPYDIIDISNKINKLMYKDNLKEKSSFSRQIIKGWNFENSKKNLMKIIELINIY